MKLIMCVFIDRQSNLMYTYVIELIKEVFYHDNK